MIRGFNNVMRTEFMYSLLDWETHSDGQATRFKKPNSHGLLLVPSCRKGIFQIYRVLYHLKFGFMDALRQIELDLLAKFGKMRKSEYIVQRD